MDRKRVGVLIIAIVVGVLAGSIIGQILAVVFDNLGLQNNVVEKVLVKSYPYEFYPVRLNLIILTLTFGFSIDFNVLSLLGIGAAWYYVKYSY